jgi:hypothetical protein
VRVTQRQVELLALHRGAIADADDGELLLETLGHAGDHVVHQRPRGAGNGARQRRIVGALELEQVALLGHLHQRVHLMLQVPLGALDAELGARERDLHPARDRHRIFRDS